MARLLRRRIRRIMVDIDTQYDRLYRSELQADQHPELQAGHRPDLQVDQLLRNIRRLIAWARVRHIPVISTALARRDNHTNNIDISVSRQDCIEGTPGQQKIGYTLLGRRIVFGSENRLDLPPRLLINYQQVIFEKRSEDPFTQPRADRMFSECRADEFIVFGMGVENAIKSTVLGLLCRKKKVLLVTDAIDADTCKERRQALRQMEAKGARPINSATLTGLSRLICSTPHLKHLRAQASATTSIH